MKFRLSVVALFATSILLFDRCRKNDQTKNENITRYFLSDIRPRFFENLNFQSNTVVSNIPSFLDDFDHTYNKYETEYKAGLFQSVADLENMRLMGEYYSFYMVALALNYVDGNIKFSDILGKRERGLFSNLSKTDPGFEQKELEAMMEKASTASYQTINIHGYNDKSFGFYTGVKQVQGRLKNKFHFNDPTLQDSLINYVGTRLVHFDNLPDWNILMAMVTFTNYADSLNTFKNPAMNKVLEQVNARLVPGSLADLGGRYPEILGPLYRFDLNMKKVDWFLQQNEVLGDKDLNELDGYITTLETSSGYIETKKKALLNSWEDKATFDERKQKLNEIKTYRTSVSFGNRNATKPVLGEFLNSKGFKRAYQCYSCHRASGL